MSRVEGAEEEEGPAPEAAGAAAPDAATATPAIGPSRTRRGRRLRIPALWIIFGCVGGIAVLVGVFGRRDPLPVEEHRLRAAVREYNQALVRAYASQRAELLDEVAGPEEVSRVSMLIFGLARQKKILESRQEEFVVEHHEFLSAAPAASRPLPQATLIATEVWAFKQVQGHKKDTQAPAKRVRYRVRYSLTEDSDRWKVTEVELLSSEELSSK